MNRGEKGFVLFYCAYMLAYTPCFFLLMPRYFRQVMPFHILGMLLGIPFLIIVFRDLYKRHFPNSNTKVTWAILFLIFGPSVIIYLCKHGFRPRPASDDSIGPILEPQGDPLPPKRRWYQFRLRWPLVLLVICSIPCSWFTLTLRHAKKQHAAVEAIERLGGSVVYDYEFGEGWSPDCDGRTVKQPGPAWLRKALGEDCFKTVDSVTLDRTDITDAWLQHLRELPRIALLSLNNTSVTDTGLEHIKDLTQLGVLFLKNTKVTDTGLECLKGLKGLAVLSLDGTQVTDTGLIHLRGLNQLRCLHLNGTQITDSGLRHFKELTGLVELSLNDTRVSNAGLEHLTGLTKLTGLKLVGTKVTLDGVKRLQEALLNCEITWEGSMPRGKP